MGGGSTADRFRRQAATLERVLRAILAGVLVSACTPLCSGGDCTSDDDAQVDHRDGWDDPIGRGYVYAVSTIQIADGLLGFDLDGSCLGHACVDNRLSALAGLLNAHIQLQHERGHGLTLLELAGAEGAFLEDDAQVTVKMYEGRDWLDPPFPDDDYRVGDPSCCRFFVERRSTIGDPAQARLRAPGKITGGVVKDAGLGMLAFTLPLSTGPRLLTLAHPRFQMERATDFDRTLVILLGGAVPASELASAANPFCRGTLDSSCRIQEASLLDFLVSHGIEPDLDEDGDGLETFEFDPRTGHLSACFEGCVERCPQQLPIAPVEPASPESCAFSGSVRDAYSIALIMSATPAFILGVR